MEGVVVYHFKTFIFMLPFFLLGCAGPMSPFGAINTQEATLDEFEKEHKPPSTGHSVYFTPSRQVLHGLSDLDVKINSADTIKSDYLLKIYYNNRDVTKAYLNHSETTLLPESNQIELEFKTLRLPPDRFHYIVIAFQPSAESTLVMAQYLPPTCNKSEESELRSTGNFSPPINFVEWIRFTAKKSGYNPNFIAGLIAQESGFNEKSLSNSRALGLTQITPNADEEIEKLRPNWPRYSKISDASILKLRALIASGRLNGKTDWRLNPEKSIEGGILYLEYLTKYWEKPENIQLIKSNYADFDLGITTVIIASYNSGATRVKRAMQEEGKHWLQSQDLTEARKYVNSVMSYCYHFSKKES